MAKIKDNVLSVGIAVLLTIFLAYGAFILYPGPDYEECYGSAQLLREPPTGNNTFNETAQRELQECSERLDDERENSQLMKAVLLSIAGALAIAAGAVIGRRSESVGNGIFAGGILTVVWGTLNNWGSLNQYLRLFLLAVALGILIYIGYRKSR